MARSVQLFRHMTRAVLMLKSARKGCGKSAALTMYVFTNFIVLLLFYFGSVSEYFTV